MGEYIAKVNINGDRFLNFADCPGRVNPDYYMIARFGRRCSSEMLEGYGLSNIHKNALKPSCSFIGTAYRSIKDLCEPEYTHAEYIAAEKIWFDGICVMAKREGTDTSNGLYLAAKGGNNGESHNHNDVGSFIIYSDGNPLIIDVGVGTYTADTFNANRWKIWTMQSAYHNIPTINGKMQPPGGQYKADNILYNKDDGSLSMDLVNAYPKDSNIIYFKRSFSLDNGTVMITDDIKLNGHGEVEFNLMTADIPDIKEGKIVFANGRIAQYDKTLSADLDIIELNDKKIAAGWGRNELYRIRLKTAPDFTEGKFILSVK
jgi:hypothetical protein